MKVQNKAFIVTGAGGGIGRELVFCLLSKGSRVAGVDLAPQSLEQTATLTDRYQDQFEGFVVNVTDRSAVEALPEQVIKRFGAVDGLINNTGIIQPFCRLTDLDYSTIQRVVNVNLLGTLFCTKTFLPHLLERPEAHIVNVSSMGGFVPVPGQTMYCAAKAAVKLMSEGLASELVGTPVQVSVVFLGAVATKIRENSGVTSPQPSEGSGGTKAVTAKEAAAMIVRGIEWNTHRIFVGKDASMMDKLYRLNPDYAARAIANKMRALLPACGTPRDLQFMERRWRASDSGAALASVAAVLNRTCWANCGRIDTPPQVDRQACRRRGKCPSPIKQDRYASSGSEHRH